MVIKRSPRGPASLNVLRLNEIGRVISTTCTTGYLEDGVAATGLDVTLSGTRQTPMP